MRCGLIGLAFLVILKNLPYLAPSVTPICATTPLPEQKIALAMLAAREIFSITTLTVSPEQSGQTWSGMTGQGILSVEAVLSDTSKLLVSCVLPCGGTVYIQGDNNIQKRATLSSSGELSVALGELQGDHHYYLEVTLVDQREPPLIFALNVESTMGGIYE
jgi:hypothetical protein